MMLLVNNTFPCDDVLRGWKYAVGIQQSPGVLFAAVWRPLPSGNFLLVHKTFLSTTRTGYFMGVTYLDTPVHVRKGDFIGYHKATSGTQINLQTMRYNTSYIFFKAYVGDFKDDELPVGKQLSTSSLTFAYELCGMIAIMKRPCKDINLCTISLLIFFLDEIDRFINMFIIICHMTIGVGNHTIFKPLCAGF